MKLLTKFSLWAGVLLLAFGVSKADISAFTFNQSTGNTYTEITGGTQLATNADDNTYTSNAIGFTFNYNNADFTTFSVSANAYLCLGNSIPTDYYNPISETGYSNVISALGSDCYIYSANSSELRFQTLGNSPNRVLVVQWKNLSPYGTQANYMNIQIRLYEGSGTVEFWYGASTMTTSQSRTYQVGIKGASTNDFMNRMVTSGTHTWPTSVVGTANNSNCYQDQSLYPTNGLKYQWARVPMSYQTTNVYQITNKVPRNTTTNPVMVIEVVTPGVGSPMSLQQLNCSTNGTTNTGGISNATVYYTANSGVFSNKTQFGSTISSPSGNMVFNGTQQLKAGNNYFWVCYDVLSTATLGNVIDAECASVKVGDTIRTIGLPAPAGSRLIGDNFNGDYTVGSGGTYSNLTSAFADIADLGLKGDVTLKIVSDILEPGSAYLPQWVEYGSGSGYKLNIIPDGAPRTLSTSTGSAVVWLHGCDNVTIDGRLDGSGRNLTFQNNLTSGTAAGIILTKSETASAGAKNCTIRNSIIKSGLNTNTASYGIFVGATTASLNTAGDDNVSLTIQDNQISRANQGIYAYKTTSDKTMSGLTIKNNIIGSGTASEYIRQYSMYLSELTNATVDGNDVFNMKNNPSTNIAAIYILGATNSGLKVTNNKIHGIYNQSTGGWAAYGVLVAAGSGVLMSNNFIYDMICYNYAGTTYNAFGIRLQGGTGHKIYNNTVNFYGTVVGGTAVPTTAPLIVTTSSVTSLDIRNNIFRNYMSTAVANPKFYTAYFPSGTVLTDCNFNVYDKGPQGILGFFAADKTTILDWRTSTTKDQNSLAQSVSLLSDSDPHLFAGWMSLTGSLISGITTDIDGETRKTGSTNIGADEVSPILSAGTELTQISTPFCQGNNADLTFVPQANTYADGFSRPSAGDITSLCAYIWYKDGIVVANSNSNTFSNSTSNVFTLRNVKSTDMGTYYVNVAWLNSPTLQSQNSYIFMEFPIQIQTQPVSGENCQDNLTHKLSIVAGGTITGYQWQKEVPTGSGTWVDQAGATQKDFSINISGGSTASGNYRCIVMGPGNCGPKTESSAKANLFIADRLSAYSAKTNFADPKYICNGSQIIFTANAAGTIIGYQWQKSPDGAVFSDLDFKKFPTSRSQNFIIDNAQVIASGFYRCVITAHKDCDITSVNTNSVETKVWPFFKLANNPESQVVCAAQDVILSVIPDGTVLLNDHPYQWQKDGVDIDGTKNASALTPILQITAVGYEASGSYRCIVHYDDCTGQGYFTSEEAQVYILRSTEIVSQPDSKLADLGGTITFNFDAHLNTYPPKWQPEVQWYRGATKLTDDNRISGATSDVLTISKITASDFANDYHVVVKGQCGTATSVNFSLAQKASINITQEPANFNDCEGGNVQMQVAANIAGTVNLPSYQWFKDGVKLDNTGSISGATTDIFQITGVLAADEGAYNCIISVEPSPGLMVTKTSAMATVMVKANPVFTQQPEASISAETGREIKIEIAAKGFAPLSYQWQKDGSDIAGETNQVFTKAAAAASDAGNYTCKVMNECMEITSTPCVVAVTLVNGTDVPVVQAGGFELFNNTPNPFAGSTTIKFMVPQTSDVKLVLTDMFGREIATLANGIYGTGIHEVTLNTNELNVASGVYYYTMTAKGFTATKQMTVIK